MYLNLEENFFSIFQLVTREACIKDMLSSFNSADPRDAHNFMKIAERLVWIRLFFTENKNVYSNSMLKFIISKIKDILNLINVEAYKVTDE